MRIRSAHHSMGRFVAAGVVALAAGAAGLTATSGRAEAQLPQCSGNAVVQTAPYACTATRTIDGTAFTVVLRVSADRAVTAEYTLDAPRAVATPIRVESHIGVGGTPPASGRAVGEIPAGETSASLAVTLMCGQIDVKAVTLGNGHPAGRIAAPYVTTTDNCTPPSTTVPTTPAPTSAVPTTTPTTAAATTSASVLPASVLPRTGPGQPAPVLWVVVAAVALGSAAIVLAARRRVTDG